MKKISKLLIMSLFMLTLIAIPFNTQAYEANLIKEIPFNKATCELRMAERRLWIDHVGWTRSFIELAGKVTDAAKNNNKSDLEKYNKLWYKNADEIANFLSSANPNYSNEVLKDMLHKHLQFVTDQVVARINKDWQADIDAYDKGEDHMIKFADILVDGIIKQFPEKFNK